MYRTHPPHITLHTQQIHMRSEVMLYVTAVVYIFSTDVDSRAGLLCLKMSVRNCWAFEFQIKAHVNSYTNDAYTAEDPRQNRDRQQRRHQGYPHQQQQKNVSHRTCATISRVSSGYWAMK